MTFVHRSTLAAIGLSALLLGACSSDSADGVATLAGADIAAAADGAAGGTLTEAEREEALLAFSQCMRDNGVADFPDPEPDEDGNLRLGFRGGAGDGEFDREAIATARDACGDLIEGIGGGPGGGNGPGGGQGFDPELFLAFAECMRTNGVADFPDPGADGRPDREAMQALDVQSDEFQAASATCAEEVGFSFGGGRGPGAGGGPAANNGAGADS